MGINVTTSVQERYSEGANARQAELCCPVDYNTEYLKIIPSEVIERDYGCGDPSQYVREGDVVLDLGSGGGKICFIASQVVGEKGRVIGVDMTDDMLDLARRNAPIVAEKIGYSNVEFRKGQIQDLKTDMGLVDEYLNDHPVTDSASYAALQNKMAEIREASPLIADDSIDIIVSNCVLNLVSDQEKKELFKEMFRVLKPGGRIAISDIVSDEYSPEHLKRDEKLWSGCISGAFQEAEFGELLEEVGFYGITIDKLDQTPWQVVEGIEYRSMTILAWKGDPATEYDKNQAVIYKGPFKEVTDEEGRTFPRGKRMAVGDKTFARMQKEPYKSHMEFVEPLIAVTEDIPLSCCSFKERTPEETKRGAEKLTTDPSQSSGCC
ncbi:methyltransferase domain-containing protein [Pseudemcibacter aquimaris]|uniref:methyltransferase domain-containing protein n=1 Tax=Pseudemcibacter aquimaris TaxID=2857064 RepID=UPI002013678A|nr:methyltransferase domain-containing protein [Pseudemcibacter aquimaris]MCC3860152.1 methyltransferase domain-containing protein [Pseudemcibacter aquimaris]WDU57480.1 methyltransferase domain-containing protein [Pseudemcibacter aquimaris]